MDFPTLSYGFSTSSLKAMASHSSTLAYKIPWMEEPGRLQSMGSYKSDATEWLHFHFSLSHNGEGNGNPLQCSCLENPRDGGAWWATVYGVAQSQTRLKRLSSSSKWHLTDINYNSVLLLTSVRDTCALIYYVWLPFFNLRVKFIICADQSERSM